MTSVYDAYIRINISKRDSCICLQSLLFHMINKPVNINQTSKKVCLGPHHFNI